MPFKVIDEIMVCDDCIMVIANNDWTGIEDRDIRRVKAGIKALPNHTCAGDSDKYESFSWRDCDCCGALAGSRYHVVILGEDN